MRRVMTMHDNCLIVAIRSFNQNAFEWDYVVFQSNGSTLNIDFW